MYEQEIYDAVAGIKPASDLRKRVIMNVGAYAEKRFRVAGRSDRHRDSILLPHIDADVYNPDYFKNTTFFLTHSDLLSAELALLTYSYGLL